MKALIKTSWILMVMLLTAFTGVVLFDLTETEPNNTAASADPAVLYQNTNFAAITPIGDVDYFSFYGENTSWGFVALVNTDNSSTSQEGILTAYATDGTTQLTSDLNSWNMGSGIALQSFVDGGGTYYLKVNEENNDDTIDTYSLEIFKTVILTQPEAEPNHTYAAAQVSGFTMAGTILTSADKDCYAFHGIDGYEYVIALNSDPEKDGGPNNYVLQLYDSTGSLMSTANSSTGNNPEFIVTEPLLTDGVYAYCVSEANAANFGSGHTYHAGLMSKGGLYDVDYITVNDWLDPRPGNVAQIGDTMTFNIGVENPGPLTLPGAINLSVYFDPACVEFVSADVAPSFTTVGHIDWSAAASNLPSGDTVDITVVFHALKQCNDSIDMGVSFNYYFTGAGKSTAYTILGNTYLPVIIR